MNQSVMQSTYHQNSLFSTHNATTTNRHFTSCHNMPAGTQDNQVLSEQYLDQLQQERYKRMLSSNGQMKTDYLNKLLTRPEQEFDPEEYEEAVQALKEILLIQEDKTSLQSQVLDQSQKELNRIQQIRTDTNDRYQNYKNRSEELRKRILGLSERLETLKVFKSCLEGSNTLDKNGTKSAAHLKSLKKISRNIDVAFLQLGLRQVVTTDDVICQKEQMVFQIQEELQQQKVNLEYELKKAKVVNLDRPALAMKLAKIAEIKEFNPSEELLALQSIIKGIVVLKAKLKEKEISKKLFNENEEKELDGLRSKILATRRRTEELRQSLSDEVVFVGDSVSQASDYSDGNGHELSQLSENSVPYKFSHTETK